MAARRSGAGLTVDCGTDRDGTAGPARRSGTTRQRDDAERGRTADVDVVVLGQVLQDCDHLGNLGRLGRGEASWCGRGSLEIEPSG